MGADDVASAVCKKERVRGEGRAQISAVTLRADYEKNAVLFSPAPFLVDDGLSPDGIRRRPQRNNKRICVSHCVLQTGSPLL